MTGPSDRSAAPHTKDQTQAAKTVVITGGTSGIGYEAVQAIASAGMGWHVIIGARNPEKATATVASLRERSGARDIETLPLDLASLTSVRAFASAVAERGGPPIRGLVFNAGTIVMRGSTRTADGFETTFGVNYLGHFLLANLLAPRLTAPARIVFVTSQNHDPAATRIGRLVPPRYLPPHLLANGVAMSPMSRYATAKLCTVLCAYELDRRLRRTGRSSADRPITVNAFTPGAVPTTGMAAELGALPRLLLSQGWFVRLLGGELQTAAYAGAALARLMLDPAVAHVSAKYFDTYRATKSSAESYDLAKAAELWDASAALVGLTPEEAALG